VKVNVGFRSYSTQSIQLFSSFVGWVKQRAPNKTIVPMGSLRLTHPTRQIGLTVYLMD